MERMEEGTVGEVLAVGGGRNQGSEPIDEFALSRTAASNPNVCFLPTASGDSDKDIDEFYAAFDSRASAVHLSLFRRSRRDLADTLRRADLIVIGGGNAANLLALWRLHGVDSLVLKAHKRGAVILGFSAGASALFERSVSDSFGGLSGLDGGLGLVAGSFCAHYSSPCRAPKCRDLAKHGWQHGYAVDEGAALHFVAGEPRGVLGWRPGAKGYRLSAGEATPVANLVRNDAPSGRSR